MSRWEDEFNKHPIHETLNWLASLTELGDREIAENESQEQRRLKKVIDRFRSELQREDPELLAFRQLDALNNQLRHQNLATQVAAFNQNGNVAHLAEINNQVTAQLPAFFLSSSLSAHAEADSRIDLSALEGQVDSSINSLVKKRDQMSQQLENVKKTSDEQKLKIDALAKAITEKEAELAKLVSEWQGQFSSAQDSRSQEFSKWRDTFTASKEQEAVQLIQKMKSALDEDRKEFDSQFKNIIDDSRERHRSILDLYELTAGDSVGAAYLQDAKEEGKKANRWRSFSIVFILLTVVWLGFSYYGDVTRYREGLASGVALTTQKPSGGNENPTGNNLKVSSSVSMVQNGNFSFDGIVLMLVTVSVSGVLLWGAAYCAQQSTKHRINERRAKWFALEVKAFDPFVNSLDKDKQSELKRQLAERLFGQNAWREEREPRIVDEHVTKSVIESLTSLVTKVKGS